MRLPLLACVASVAAYSAKLQTHMYQTTDLWRDLDVPSLRPVSTAQSPAATKLSLLDEAPDNEDPNNTTYCVAHGGQTTLVPRAAAPTCALSVPLSLSRLLKGRRLGLQLCTFPLVWP